MTGFDLLQLALGLTGALVVLGTLRSAVRTFVLPRSARDPVTRIVFVVARVLFTWRARRTREYAVRDRIMALYAPVTVLLLMLAWVALIAGGFTLVFWALGTSWARAFLLSGSSLLTLGFEKPEGMAQVLAAFAEAAIGLTMVALLVSYLPAMYSAFARREAAVTMLEVRAGAPPEAAELLVRVQELGGLAELERYFESWQHWFVELEESHTSLAALTFFRSPKAHRSWVTASGAVLDAAALAGAVLRRGPSPAERLTLRAGAFALRHIAEFFRLEHEAHPDPRGPVSVERAEFDAACERLARGGLEIRSDGEQAWADFVAARVEYDDVLRALAELTMAPSAPWLTDHVRRPIEGTRARPRVAPRVADPTALDEPPEPGR